MKKKNIYIVKFVKYIMQSHDGELPDFKSNGGIFQALYLAGLQVEFSGAETWVGVFMARNILS